LYIDCIIKKDKKIKVMFGKIDIEKTKGSLLVRNEIIEKLDKELGVKFGFRYNDLYGVKGGVVRRLKGGIVNKEMMERGSDIKMFNELFNKVKEFVENLEFENYKIEFNKKMNYGWYDYMRMKECGFEGNFNDYKNFRIENEGNLILKIKWEVE
jgi:hypothetical protein